MPVCMCPCISKKDDFICGLPKRYIPVRLPQSYSLGPLVDIIWCCGHIKGPVPFVLKAPYGSALKTTIHGSCGLRTGSVWCLEILTGPAQADMTDYRRFAYGCSQAHTASARACRMPTRAPYVTHRVDVQVLYDPEECLYAYDHPHWRRRISCTDFPRVIGIMQCWAFYALSACSLVTGLQDTIRVPYMFCKAHMRAP